jgi:5-methylcytosine-specific restriction endonuclease McrA
MSTARYTLTAEHRARIAKSLTGKTLSVETRAKIRAARLRRKETLGYVISPETAAKISAAHTRRRELGITRSVWVHDGQFDMNAYHKQWRRDNPDKLSQKYRTRLARVRGAPGKHTLNEWNALKEKYRHTCPSCLRREPETKLTADHIVPIARGGSNDISNIQPLCLSCNAKKHLTTIRYEVPQQTI